MMEGAGNGKGGIEGEEKGYNLQGGGAPVSGNGIPLELVLGLVVL